MMSLSRNLGKGFGRFIHGQGDADTESAREFGRNVCAAYHASFDSRLPSTRRTAGKGFVAAALLFVGCGGKGGGVSPTTTTTDSTAPVITLFSTGKAQNGISRNVYDLNGSVDFRVAANDPQSTISDTFIDLDARNGTLDRDLTGVLGGATSGAIGTTGKYTATLQVTSEGGIITQALDYFISRYPGIHEVTSTFDELSVKDNVIGGPIPLASWLANVKGELSLAGQTEVNSLEDQINNSAVNDGVETIRNVFYGKVNPAFIVYEMQVNDATKTVGHGNTYFMVMQISDTLRAELDQKATLMIPEFTTQAEKNGTHLSVFTKIGSSKPVIGYTATAEDFIADGGITEFFIDGDARNGTDTSDINDTSLGMDTDTLAGNHSDSYDTLGKYTATANAKSTSGVAARSKDVFVTQYNGVYEIKDELSQLSFAGDVVGGSVTKKTWNDLVKPLLTENTRIELNTLENVIDQSTIDEFTDVYVADSEDDGKMHIIYRMNIKKAGQFTGYTNGDYYLVKAASTTLRNVLGVNVLSRELNEVETSTFIETSGVSLQATPTEGQLGLPTGNGTFKKILTFSTGGRLVQVGFNYPTTNQPAVTLYNTTFLNPDDPANSPKAYQPFSATQFTLEQNIFNTAQIYNKVIDFHEDQNQ